MTNVPIIDQPRWPALDAETTPPFMDFKLASDSPTSRSSTKTRSGSTDSKASRRAPNSKPRFACPRLISFSKPIQWEPSNCDFAVMGSEVNGKCYEAAKGRTLLEGNRKICDRARSRRPRDCRYLDAAMRQLRVQGWFRWAGVGNLIAFYGGRC